VLATLLLVSSITVFSQDDGMIRSLQMRSLQVASLVETRISWVGQFIRALQENKTLRNENVALNTQIARLNVVRQENEQLKQALQFKQEAAYEMVAARIVARDIFGQHNYLTLDVGAADGVASDMPVVNENGIVGRVLLVSENFARVLPLLNTRFHVPVEVQPSLATGLASWSGGRTDMMDLKHIVKTTKVELGDTVLTSAISGIFPPGYLVGTIVEKTEIPGLNTLDLKIRTAVSISSTRHVLVLLYQYEAEQEALEGEEIF